MKKRKTVSLVTLVSHYFKSLYFSSIYSGKSPFTERRLCSAANRPTRATLCWSNNRTVAGRVCATSHRLWSGGAGSSRSSSAISSAATLSRIGSVGWTVETSEWALCSPVVKAALRLNIAPPGPGTASSGSDVHSAVPVSLLLLLSISFIQSQEFFRDSCKMLLRVSWVLAVGFAREMPWRRFKAKGRGKELSGKYATPKGWAQRRTINQLSSFVMQIQIHRSK